MTCVVGIRDGNHVYLGADSCGSDEFIKQTRLDPKVFLRDPFVIGFTDSFRMGQVLRYKFNPPEQPASMDDYEYMVTMFIDSVRQCFRNAGFASKENDVENGGTFLVGYKGQLYVIDEDYQVGIVAENYAAIGCGEAFAQGALFALAASTKRTSTKDRIRIALEAAAQFAVGVGGPFNYVSTKEIEE
jgi:20S proteasome alpha/beta subunit